MNFIIQSKYFSKFILTNVWAEKSMSLPCTTNTKGKKKYIFSFQYSFWESLNQVVLQTLVGALGVEELLTEYSVKFFSSAVQGFLNPVDLQLNTVCFACDCINAGNQIYRHSLNYKYTKIIFIKDKSNVKQQSARFLKERNLRRYLIRG